MTENMGKWPSKCGLIIKIKPLDGCKGKRIHVAVGQWYSFHQFRCHLGNVGEIA